MRGAGKFVVALTLVANAQAGASCDRPVYLTFDTGHMGVAPHIAQVLQRQQVRVTFLLPTRKPAKATARWASTGPAGGANAPAKAMPLPATL